MKRMWLIAILAPLAASQWAVAAGKPGWVKGKGYGWIWGKDDEVGALNAMTDESRRAAMQLISKGESYDLGITYDRSSYKWPGHSPGEIMTFRSPEGVKRQKDMEVSDSRAGTAWHSCALYISDNIATQIDGLGHATNGDDNHIYNGFTEAEAGGDFGLRKCGAETIPPIVARGVMLDIAGLNNVDALPKDYVITIDDMKAALAKQKLELRPGDVVLLRTGTLRYWKETGADHDKIAEHDSAGLPLDGAKWLVEQHGAMMIGSDTSGLESWVAAKGHDSFMPVHVYLLIEQGVHIAEFHYLEDLARDKVYEFCYIAAVNKIKGATAGFAMRPLAMK